MGLQGMNAENKILPPLVQNMFMNKESSIFAIPILKSKFSINIGYSAFENGEYPFVEK
jgi:hypothetical protein